MRGRFQWAAKGGACSRTQRSFMSTATSLPTLTAKDLASDQDVRWGPCCGDYSPTSRTGTRTKSSPLGSIDNPLRPLSLAIGAEATFVARTVDVDVAHLTETLRRAAAHKGSAFVEVYQNCKIFNDGVFEYATDKGIKADNTLYLEHRKPLIFGKDRNKGIRLHGLDPEVVTLTNGITVDDLLIHDERAEEPSLAYLLSRMV